MLKDTQTPNDAEEIIRNNMSKIKETIKSVINSENYHIDFGTSFFPKKVYKGVIYEEGYYNSLVVTLGAGAGDNWWCILFPPLCLLEDNPTIKDVEYQFCVSRIIKSFR